MNTKALRQKVLDLAIHGKLVPQNPNDESATILLEKIRAEKAEKIKKGELKADKKDSFIFVGSDKRHYEQFADGTVKDIEDEIPFNIPEGWAWCRLKQLSLDMADGPFGSNLKAEHYTKNKEARIIQLSNIGEYGWREENTKYTTLEHAKNNISRSIVEPGNLVIAKMMPAGKAIICPNNEKMYVLSSDAVKLVPTSLINSNYLLNSINSPFFRASVTDNVQGTTRLRTSISKLRECFFPLPPFAEQERIVSSIESIFAQINNLEESKSNLESVIKQTKSKILDLAIHGKLVPQDPNDEPAEELLKRISTSDNRPYKKFEEDEVPFIIPFNWKWERLAKISSIISKGTTPRGGKNAYCIEGINYLRVENISADGTINLEDINHISENEHLTFLKRSILQENDVIISIAGTLGKIGIIRKCDLPMNTNQAIAFVRISNLSIINLKYLRYVLESVELQRLLLSQTKVTSIPNLTLEIINNCPIPLPPIQEQNRIVSKIEELFSYLDTLSSNLE